MTELIVCEGIIRQGRSHVLKTLSCLGVDLAIIQEIKATFHMIPRATVDDLVNVASQIANIIQMQHETLNTLKTYDCRSDRKV